ncbi:flagellar assembly protein FliW [Caminibacter sp.]
MLSIKKPIPGFEKYYEAEFKQIDDVFEVLKIGNFVFTLINPFVLIKDYSFEIPKDVEVLMDLSKDNPPLVYCNIVKQEPFENSIVNFKAPILINPKNNTLAQIILDNYGVAAIKEFL